MRPSTCGDFRNLRGQRRRIVATPPAAFALGAILLAAAVLTPPGPLARARAQDAPAATIEATVRDLLAALDEQPVDALWKTVLRIESLGAESVLPVLRKELDRSGELSRLGCAKALVEIGQPEDKDIGLASLAGLLSTSRRPEVRIAAIKLLNEHGDPEEALELFQGKIGGESDPAVIIALAQALWDIDHVPDARKRLLDLIGSRDATVRNAAAIALAEIDYFEGPVRDILRELAQEPTLQGRLASSLLRSGQMARQIDRMLESGDALLSGADPAVLLREKERKIRELETRIDDLRRGGVGAPGGESYAVLEEVLSRVEELYVERDRLTRLELIVAAIKGLTRSLDPFSSFLDPEEAKRFLADISGEYCGIGAQVGKSSPDGPLEILKPIYKGPAYEAGILTGDQILEIDGQSTAELTVEEIVENLKGEPGSEARLTVYRAGWGEPRKIELVRRTIDVPSVTHNVLPGKVGLVRLFQFGEKSFEEFKAAVDDLRAQGCQGIIIDLRNNPGGLLTAALDIVDLFVGEEELPIVTQRGADKDEGVEQTFPDAAALSDPLVILINQRSASASEIVAGALRDYHRATLVGQRTYGKGSVQRLIPMTQKSQTILGGEARLRLTVQYYYLPSGRCIHALRDANGRIVPGNEGGVPPDVDVAARTYPGWVLEEIESIRGSHKIIDYVRERYDALEKLVVAGDAGEMSRYPEFDALYESLSTRASRDLVRQMVRFQMRRRFEDQRGEELAGDIADDAQLQAGVLELLRKIGRDAKTDPDYGWIARRGEGETPDAGAPAAAGKSEESKDSEK